MDSVPVPPRDDESGPWSLYSNGSWEIALRRSRKPIVIASRRSRLARIQAESVGAALARLHPHVEVRYEWIESEGDRFAEGSLADHGGKGLFTRAIEQALLKGDADIAVHSLKDLPAKDTAGLTIAATPVRADVRDVLIAREEAATLHDLQPGAVVGTSSPRRAAQLRRLRGDLRVALIRGNVDTRLTKVLDPQGAHSYDATLLAYAGLQRLGLHDKTHAALPLDDMLPASCQGALGIQCRSSDHVTLTRCLPLNHPSSATAAHAERQVIAGLGAECHSPIAVYAQPIEPEAADKPRQGDTVFRLRVRVLSPDGAVCLESDAQTPTKLLRKLIKQTIADLKQRGAADLLHPGPGAIPDRVTA